MPRLRRSALSVCHVSQCRYEANVVLGSCDKNSNVTAGKIGSHRQRIFFVLLTKCMHNTCCNGCNGMYVIVQ